jgi:LCP family protein required for cell wall assembly
MDRYELLDGGDDLGPVGNGDHMGGGRPLYRDEVAPGTRSEGLGRSQGPRRSAGPGRSGGTTAVAVSDPQAPPAADQPRTRRGKVPRRYRYTRWQRVLGWTALVTTVLVTATALAAYAEYRHLLGNIGREDVTGLLGHRPPKYNSALNILIIGSDSRAGSNAQYGTGVQGARSDTMLLMHISPRRNGVTMISFPRDSMVPQLACKGDNQGHAGQQADNTQEQLNATFNSGGAPCLWKTLEALTGVRIDHFVQLDFSGFQTMVNAVGGVNVCLPVAVDDPASKLNLGAGQHHVDGAQALAFVRERHIGTGSDLQRIQRQQYFMAALAKEALSSNVLANPGKLYSLANAVTKSLTADTQLSVSNMVQIAQSMRSTQAGAVRFISAPTIPDPGNSNRVDFDPAAAPQLFDAIKYDTVSHTAPKKAKTTKKGPAKPSQPALKPSQVKVQVLNGSTVSGLAGQTGTQLGQEGFNVLGTGNATTSVAKTVIQYASARDLPAVQTLTDSLTGAQAQQVSSLQPGTVNLVVGADFKGLKPPSDLTKQYGGITGNANICKDSGAFAGPDQPSDFAP